jgi:hypothetical protein
VTESPLSADAAEGTDSTAARGSAARAYPGTPRWVKLGAIIAAVVIVLVVFIMVIAGGEHGPMRHIPSAGGTAPQIAFALLASRSS